jgi:hypothetical protein
MTHADTAKVGTCFFICSEQPKAPFLNANQLPSSPYSNRLSDKRHLRTATVLCASRTWAEQEAKESETSPLRATLHATLIVRAVSYYCASQQNIDQNKH